MSTYARTTSAFRCDECGHEMAMPLLCDACGVDYPERRRMSPFGVLGLPQSFDLDEDALDRLETNLAQRLHPDRWQGRGDRLHRKALLAWSSVNESLAAVREPWARGDTLLGLQPEVDDGSVERVQLPTSFLVEQLELQEEVDEQIEPGRKRELTKQVRAALKQIKVALAEAFAALEAAEAPKQRADAIVAAYDALDRSRYWRNVQQALRGRAAPQ
jgi:molecular chaperone HscB